MVKIKLKNNKTFTCDKDSIIFEAAKKSNVVLEHSYLSSRRLPNFKNLNIKYIPVISRQDRDWNGVKGYIQNIVLKQQFDIENTQVYACGSNDMINSAQDLFFKNNLKENNFFSDTFVQTN
jgi:NAD(P)H-flavin reductase